jgi:hypothetical protein
MGHRRGTVSHVGAPWDRPGVGELQFLAITPAKKVVVDCVGLYMIVIRVGDAGEYCTSATLEQIGVTNSSISLRNTSKTHPL